MQHRVRLEMVSARAWDGTSASDERAKVCDIPALAYIMCCSGADWRHRPTTTQMSTSEEDS
jgi:hypothetical protein